MDVNLINARLRNLETLKSDSREEWAELTSAYPYFSVAQWLLYGNSYFQGLEDKKLLSLHKSGPLEFARFVKRLERAKEEESTLLVEKNEMIKTASKLLTIDNNPPTSQPVNPQPVTLKPVTPQPISPQPVTPQPVTPQPVTLKPVTPQPLTPQPLTPQPLSPQPLTPQPVTPQPISPQPVTLKEDILELINELPNTTAFQFNESKQKESESIQIIKESRKEKTIKETPLVQKPSFESDQEEDDRSLMVMMSFSDWLNHFKLKRETEKAEEKEKKALKAAWQKVKLAEAADEEQEEIPEPIFKQAMESITMESGLMSEALAEILAKQGKKDKAIAMYKKLSLRNPEKNAYFADRINELI